MSSRGPLRALGALGVVIALVAIEALGAGATSPSPCPPPSSASDTRTTCPAVTDPTQAAYAQLTSRLGGDLATALTAQEHLSAVLDQTTTSEQILTDQISQEETVIANLEDKIAQLDAQISDTEARIEVEKEQVAAMARDIYRQPDSFWLLVARAGNLHDALQATSDLVIAGQHAHALQARLEADLAKLEADRAARQAELDRENSVRDRLVANLSLVEDLLAQQDDVSNQVADLIAQIQDAENGLQDQPADVTASLATLMEAQEQDLVQRSYQAAWSQAHVGLGLALVTHMLPLGQTIAGFHLSWPMAGGRVTQLFGPTDFTLEPPLGAYAHFHTGVDIAAPFGTTVTAAAAGVIVAVGHSQSGYGNYLVIGHGGGIMTLYGHLLETDVNVGDIVARGQRVGLEGSTGWSTGPHVHFELRVNDAVVDPMSYLTAPSS
ncbi:MAG: peptidoglycan DD-metalloendopeptidase family protein [Candidatus Dormiibacterota bacterium]